MKEALVYGSVVISSTMRIQALGGFTLCMLALVSGARAANTTPAVTVGVVIAPATGAANVPAANPAPVATLSPAVEASLTRSIPNHTPSTPAIDPQSAGQANLLAAEQSDVIVTDDRFYPRYRHDSNKISPLTGLPFARNTSEEFAAATATNITLRNPHHKKLLKLTSEAYPILERAVFGSVFHYWKAYKV